MTTSEYIFSITEDDTPKMSLCDITNVLNDGSYSERHRYSLNGVSFYLMSGLMESPAMALSTYDTVTGIPYFGDVVVDSRTMDLESEAVKSFIVYHEFGHLVHRHGYDIDRRGYDYTKEVEADTYALQFFDDPDELYQIGHFFASMKRIIDFDEQEARCLIMMELITDKIKSIDETYDVA